jgi:hypothetical protein
MLAAPGMPFLNLNVNVFLYPRRDSRLAAFNISLKHKELVSLVRNGKGVTAGTTWDTDLTGTVGLDNLKTITQAVSELVDNYANDYLAANPIERKGVEEKGKK